MTTVAPTQTLTFLDRAFTHAAVGVAITDLDGRFLEVNDAFCALTGYTATELKGIDPDRITHPDHRNCNSALVSKLLAGELPAFVVQTGYITKSERVVWLQNSVSIIRDVDGTPLRLLNICENTTEQRAAEQALQETQERSRVQFRATPVPIFSWQRSGHDFVLVDYNDAADRITEHGIVRLLGKRASHLYAKTPEVIDGMERCFSQRSAIHKVGDFRLLSTGELKQLDATFVFVPPDLVMIHTEDITDRVKAEQAQKEAERKYRDMFENSSLGMFQTTLDGRFRTANTALARMFGFDTATDLMREWTNIAEQGYVDPRKREEFKREIELNGVVKGFEYEAYRKDGSRIWVSETVRTVRDTTSSMILYEGVAEDVTERRQSADAIRKQKELLQTIFDNIPVMINFTDQQGVFQFVNHEFERKFGWTAEELRHHPDIIKDCYPNESDRERVRRWIADGTGEWGHFRPRLRDGRYIDAVWVNVKLSDGTSIGIGKDISKEKRAERFRDAALALSQGLNGVSSTFEAAKIISNVTDELIGWDSCSLQLYDAETDTVKSVLAIDNIAGERRDVRPRHSAQPSVRTREVIKAGPKLIIREPPLVFDDTAVPFGDVSRPSASIMSVPIRHGSGVVGVLSIESYQSEAYDEMSLKDLESLADLCGQALNRVRAEQSLYESEQRFRQIAENIDDVIWIMDTSLEKLLYVSPAYKTIWEKPLETINSDPTAYLHAIHPEDRERVAQVMAERIAKTDYSSVEYRIVRPNGSIRWIRSRSFPIRGSDGKAYRLAGIAEDITERKASETALHDFSRRLLNAHESERMKIARELHDEIGQVLTAVRINLQSLSQSSETQRTIEHVAESIRVIDEAISRVRDLSFELRPSLLDDLGLAAATRWYVNQFAHRVGLIAHLQIEFDGFQKRLSREVETACFRILQEALTNVARHAEANQITVILKTNDSQLYLCVKDDGQGLERGRSKSTLGLRGMEERALSVSGRLEILSTPSQGTEIRVWFPTPRAEI